MTTTTTGKPPMVRAGLCQQTLATLRTLEDVALSARALGSVDPGLVARVEAAGRTEWLPLDHDTALLEAIHREAGAAAHRAIWMAAMERNFQGALLGPVMKVASGMFGATPNGLLRFLPPAFQAVFKDAGRFDVVENEPGRGVAIHVDPPVLPPSHAAALAESIAATLDAGLRFGGVHGTTAIGPHEGNVGFTLTWA